MNEDYNTCQKNPDGKHGPLAANIDLDIADTHVSVTCTSCGLATGHPIDAFADDLEWN